MSMDAIAVVVAGGLGTDIFASGLKRIVGQGELGFGGRLHIGAGGKSRNIAEMMASLLGKERVAMVGRTSKDPLELYKVPLDALERAGVNLDFVKVIPFETAGKFPQVALIAVDEKGNNQIYVVPGANEDFSPDDIESALPAFKSARENGGVLALSLELPLETAVAAVKQANSIGLKVALDPGGIRSELDHKELLARKIFLLKPNEHEAQILSGVAVNDTGTAKRAAEKLLSMGIENVLITMGGRGAFLKGAGCECFIAAPEPLYGDNRDETGCGDQTMAAICASLLAGDDLERAARAGILAGTMQFCRQGIIPIKAAELEQAGCAAGIST